MTKKVCIVTGSRAEYGLLRPLIRRFYADKDTELLIAATGMHLSPEFGLTYKEIEEDGFQLSAKIETLLSGDSPGMISKSIGLGIIGFSDFFAAAKPDLVIVLGDRYEIFAAAAAALTARIPIAHIHGGETTEGMLDEAFRHSITKMSSLHFTSTEEYRKRVIQLGEAPESVYNVGALGIENIKSIHYLPAVEIEESLNIRINKPMAVVTYHPVTLENNLAEEQFDSLLKALESFPDLIVIFTESNSDEGGRIINRRIEQYCLENSEHNYCFKSLGQRKYFSLLKYADIVIGNSSSGILEVPSFHIPTVNIGDRQKGRIRADSVIDCNTKMADIVEAVQKALSDKAKKTAVECINPYEGENTSLHIYRTIKNCMEQGISLKKKFYDL